MRRRAAAIATLLALVCACHPAIARADGDPASDVLATQALFLPQDAGATSTQRAQLDALLRSAATRGFPIRVALIASSGDLGSVTALWRQPQTYARFLGQELGQVYKGPLLVVMPQGFGLTRAGKSSPRPAVLNSLAPPGNSAGLAGAAITAVQRLAAASGRPLPSPSAAAASGSSSGDPVAWIAFAAGLLAIAIAWGLSFRARPLRRADRSTEATQ